VEAGSNFTKFKIFRKTVAGVCFFKNKGISLSLFSGGDLAMNRRSYLSRREFVAVSMAAAAWSTMPVTAAAPADLAALP
jgi:hypothetical protein